MRENPYDRQRLFQRHRDELIRLKRPFEEIAGTGRERKVNAEAALRRIMAITQDKEL